MATRRKQIEIAVEPDDRHMRAMEKAQNPNMLVAGNPLAENPASVQTERIVQMNMERLYEDARMRRGVQGRVYSSIMDQRFRGG